jgi:hypothetical protein
VKEYGLYRIYVLADYNTSMSNAKSDIQKILNSVLTDLNEDSIRIFENQITSDERFQKTVVAEARKDLGIKIQTYEETGRAGIKIYADTTLAKDEVNQRVVNSPQYAQWVNRVLIDTGLPEMWREYVSAYISGQPVSKKELTIFQNEHIFVNEVNADSIVINIRKGIRYDEYIKAWEALSPYLGKGRRKNSARENAIRDLQMYHSFYFRGLTYREIAQLYLNTDIEYGIETVKKAVKRQKKLFDEGTNLTK